MGSSIMRWGNYPALSGWAFIQSPGSLIREMQEFRVRVRRTLCEDERRDESDMVTSQRMTAASRIYRWQRMTPWNPHK